MPLFKHSPLPMNWKTEWFPAAIIALLFVAAIWFYSIFPESVAVFWNFNGQASRFAPPLVAAFVLPIFTFFIYLAFLFLPQLDSHREQYYRFAYSYHQLKDVVIAFLGFIYFTISFAALDYPINVSFWVPIFVAMLFVWLGTALDKFKYNWFVGIKTPWTRQSLKVWDKTHQIGGRLFTVAGALIALTTVAPSGFRLPLFILAILLVIFGPTVYSGILYWKEHRQKK